MWFLVGVEDVFMVQIALSLNAVFAESFMLQGICTSCPWSRPLLDELCRCKV